MIAPVMPTSALAGSAAAERKIMVSVEPSLAASTERDIILRWRRSSLCLGSFKLSITTRMFPLASVEVVASGRSMASKLASPRFARAGLKKICRACLLRTARS